MNKVWSVLIVTLFCGCTAIDWDKFPKIPDTPENPEVPEEPQAGDFPDGVGWLHTDVSAWPVTINLTDVSVGGNIVYHYDTNLTKNWAKNGDKGTAINPWILAEHGGKWYARTWEWMYAGTNTKSNKIRGDHVKKAPFSGNWHPIAGQKTGHFISGLARLGRRNVQERSNIVWKTWPGGLSYDFSKMVWVEVELPKAIE